MKVNEKNEKNKKIQGVDFFIVPYQEATEYIYLL